MQQKEFGGRGEPEAGGPRGCRLGRRAGRGARETWGASLELERPVGQE